MVMLKEKILKKDFDIKLYKCFSGYFYVHISNLQVCCKIALQEELGLPARSDCPLV